MAATTAYALAMGKTVYDPEVAINKYQHSQFLHDMKKDSLPWGKNYEYACQFDDGGNFGTSYEMLSNDFTDGVQNARWSMEIGKIQGLFRTKMIDINISDTEQKAFLDVLRNEMSGCFSGMSRTLSTFLYGGKYGVLTRVKADLDLSTLGITGVEIPVDSSTLVKLGIGSRVVFASAGSANSAYPWSNLMASGKYAKVVRKTDNSIVVNFNSAFTGLTIYAGDYIELYTARKGNAFLGPEGIPDICASYISRSDPAFYVGDGTGYIEKDFRGQDRSRAVQELAGNYIEADSTQPASAKPNAAAMVKMLKLAKRGGQYSDRIHVYINDDSYENIQNTELTNQAWQTANISAPERQNLTVGVNKIGLAFEESFANKLSADASCLNGQAVFVDLDDFTWRDVDGVTSKVLDKVTNGAEGTYNIKSVGTAGFGDEIWSGGNIDHLFEVTTNGKDDDGNLWEYCAKIYGNFMSKQTGRNGVVKLTA